MNEIISSRSAEEYFDIYGRNGIVKGMDRTLVRRQLIDAFQKEIFMQVADRAKKRFDRIPEEGDPEALRIAKNIVKNETNKWIKLCRMFEQYKETSGLLHHDDITLNVEDLAKIGGE